MNSSSRARAVYVQGHDSFAIELAGKHIPTVNSLLQAQEHADHINRQLDIAALRGQYSGAGSVMINPGGAVPLMERIKSQLAKLGAKLEADDA